MLEKSFQHRFFSQLDVLTDEQMGEKIHEIQTLVKGFEVNSEAASDGRFMLRHMRRIRAEKLLGIKKNSAKTNH